MESEDKRINQLTQISSAPANGVLVVDVPGRTETNGITVDNLARTMPVATSERNGIFQGGTFYSRSFLYRNNVYDVTIDKAIETGIYYKDSAPAGMPGGSMGYVIVIAADIYVKQIYENLKDGRAFSRISIDKGKTWGSWNAR